MNKIKLKIAHQDKRGVIIDILENQKINAITLITIKKGAVREIIITRKLISGIISFQVKCSCYFKGKKIKKITLKPGDMH